MIPYGKQTIDGADILAVTEVLKSDWLTQGPKVAEFEQALARYCGAKYAVVFSNGTAALHAAYFAAGLGKGDEFITAPLTFVATANAGLYLGATPVFADINNCGNLDPQEVERKITRKTKLISVVDYAGQPADLDAFKKIAKKHGLILVEDACHALGADYKGKKIGSISDMTVFSFHPVKSITTGEGGAVLTDDKTFCDKLKMFRTHGITKDVAKLKNNPEGSWYYEMQELGFNYRLTDMQSALGISQLKKLDGFISARKKVAQRYGAAFKKSSDYLEIFEGANSSSAWHLYVIRLRGGLVKKRAEIFKKLQEAGIGVQVHYIPVYWQPYYKQLGYKKGSCPNAEAFYRSAISLPIFPSLKAKDQEYVIQTLRKIITE